MKTNQWIGIGLFLMCLVITLPVVHAGTLNLQYDANGNLVTGDGKFRVYNSLDQLAEVRNGSASDGVLLEDYVYHPMEERILYKRVYEAAAVKDTVYYIDENFVRVANSSGSYDFTYVKHEGQLVAQLNPDGTKYFVHGDHLGSTSTVTNSTGSVIESTTYTPYGEILSGGTVSRFDYTGKEYSSVVGDYDYNFRKYNPTWAFFNQPDNLLPNVYDPQQLNRYSYARNNPYRYKDKDGHVADDFLIGITSISLAVTFLLFEVEANKIRKETGQLKTEDKQQQSKAIVDLVVESVKFIAETKGVSAPGVTGTVDIVKPNPINALKKRLNENVQLIRKYCADNPGQCVKPTLTKKELVNQEIVNKEIIQGEIYSVGESSTGGGGQSGEGRRSQGEALKRFWESKKNGGTTKQT